ncbi:microcephalin-like [Pecten maximus]|uniref:microcephalin-like n=1 Tax=Pecten maximus TaxID=6579 RepID=UPI001458B8C4|nr:microcephalin-like [Pecten maximus]XP_033738215.1 microcephalin-like [Pecten maximus]
MANYQEDDTDLPNTQIVDDRVLKDVVAYVEVRSTNDNRTKAICKELENLGAKIKKTFTDDVTHVVYKEGCKRTRTKAQKKGVFLVSVLWVDSCKQNQEHVSERLYPASLPDDKSTPVLLTKLKKMKSMQPRDFDEDVANSAERCTKRKRKVDLLKMGKDSTPCNSPGLGGILVWETQPRSPEEIPTPLRLTIPDTPPSMRAKMKDLELRRNNGTSLSDLSLNKDNTAEDEPLIRKLFSTDNIDVEEEDPLLALNRAKSTGKTAVDDGRSKQTAATLETLETPKLPSTKRMNNRRKSMPSVKISEKDYVDLPTRSSRRRKSLVVTSVSLDSNVTEESSDIPTNSNDTDNSNIGQQDIVPVRTGENLSDCTGKKSELLLKEPGQGNSKTAVKGRRKSMVCKSNATKPVVENVSSIKGGEANVISSNKVTSRGGGACRGRGRASEPSPDRLTRKGVGASRGRASEPSLVKGGLTSGEASRRRSCASDTSREAVTSGRRATDPASRRGQRKSVTFTTAPDSVINQDNQSTTRKSSESEQQYSVSKTDTVSASVTAICNSNNLSSQTDNCEQISTGVHDIGEDSSDESSGNVDPPLVGYDSTRAKLQAQRKQIPTKKIKMLLPQDNLPSSFLIEPTMKSDKIQPSILDSCSIESGNVVRKGRKRKVTTDDGDKESRKKSRKGSRSDSIHPQTNDMFSSSEESDKAVSYTAPVKNIMRDMLENDSSLSASNIQTESTLQTTGPHGMSLSTVFGDDTMASSISGFAPPRPSIDEFNIKKIKSCSKPRKKAFSESSVSQHKQKFSDSDKSSSDSDGAQKSRSKFHGNVGSSFRRSPQRPSVVMTSLHSHEQDTVISIVKKIGQFVISDNVSDTTSHVICGGPRRTLNLLYAVSRGCWILHQKWVYDSLDAGQWLPEEGYEVTKWFPSVKAARLQKESLKENYKSTLFSGVGIMFVSQKTSPPRSHLAALIKLCGGQVTMSTSKAQIIVGNDFYPDRTSVSPLWILDCIIQQRLEPMEAYLQGRPKRDSSPEF